MDARTEAVLQDLVRRESRSLLQYVYDAFPWTSPDRQDAVAQVRRLSEEEARATEKLVRFLLKRHVAPLQSGAFPMEFTTINFVSLDHLVALLAKAERRGIAGLERDLDNLGDPEARGLAQELLALKQRDLQALEKLAADLPASTVR
jgi:hypothetical protein